MHHRYVGTIVWLQFLLLAPALAHAEESKPRTIQFNRDVRPILAKNCFACHGPDANQRQAGLRLDTYEGAMAERDGSRAIVPRDLGKSALWRRVSSTDADEVMPPPSSHKPPLGAAQKAILKAWIEQGGGYQRHWAFGPLNGNVQVPDTGNTNAANPIDAFVAAKLKEHGLDFAPEAEPATLIRRVSFDLTGLPPSEDLLALPYEKAVDRLLASPHFGEHMAASWLDAARYADTNGYFSDKPRQMWLWRDWVTGAFNANMPYDQFTTWQLAGDLLPQPTIQQRIATGFNRNHMANNETGSIDEEFRVEYVVDRLSTTTALWLGLTAGCAQCHDHKFDPLSQREFYQLFAFFNNVPEKGVIDSDNPPPLISVPSQDQERALQKALAEMHAATVSFAPLREQLTAGMAEWEKKAASTLSQPPEAVFHEPLDGRLGKDAKSLGTSLAFERGIHGAAAKFDATQHVEVAATSFDLDKPWTIGLWVNAEGSLSCPLSLIEPDGDRRGIELIWQKGRLQVNLVHRWGASAIEVSTLEALIAKKWHQIVVAYDGTQKAAGLRVFFDGSPTTLEIKRDTLTGSLANRQPLRIGRRDSGLGFYGSIDEVRLVSGALKDREVLDWYWGERIRGVIEMPVEKRSAADSDTLLDYYIDHFAGAEIKQARQRLRRAVEEEKTVRASIPTALVMQEMEQPRTTHVLERGQYDKPGQVVTPDVPAAIAPWPAGAPRNRLGLAQWLVSRENPLTPRVAVNRLWQQCFGEGLVRTAEDFGSQGEPPTHPELLDWLAATFRDGGWDVKSILRLIVTSKTYRQKSGIRDERDPDNLLLARGPRGRLTAEMLRDQALAVSGLLVSAIGGPSVKPYQPPGLWEAVSYNAEETYAADTGGGLWRRSLYTYVKRQAPPPMLLIFDGPTREKCTIRRPCTNTPLQALLLLNDPVFVEAARMLAARSLASAGEDLEKLRELWRRVLVRDASQDELVLVHGLLVRQRERFAKSPEGARQLLAGEAAKQDARLDACELAAWTVVAQAVLNLDEAMTKR